MLKFFSRNTKNIDSILGGLYVFYISQLFYNYIFKEAKWTRIFTFIGVYLIVCGFIKSRKSLKGCDINSVPLYMFFIVICIVNVIIGIPQMYFDGRLNEVITTPHVMWMYLIGLAFLIPVKTIEIRQIISWSLLYAITSLLFSLFYFRDFFIDATVIIQSMISWDAYILNRPQEPALLLVPIVAFFVFIKRFSFKWRLLIWVAALLAILAATLAGRRTASLMLLGYILIAIYLYAVMKKSRLIYMIVVFLLVIIVFLQFGSSSSFEKYFDKNFVVMSERLDANTRTDVESDFKKDMKEIDDWILGRGMAGTYKSLNLSLINRLQRTIVETGYLNMILHGGLLMLIPYVMLLIYSFIKGFFYSKSLFVKSCSLFILYHLFLLYPSGHLKLTLECFILFVFIRICLSPYWRNTEDSKINEKIINPIAL